MSRYAIGDIQGCYKQFMQLLDDIGFNVSKDTLYLVGDLVNRGSESLDVLKWVYKNQDSIINVLGNHDIYLLARYMGVRSADKDETIQDILNDKHANKLIDYLRGCPLVHYDNDYILVHAGIHPLIDFVSLKRINHLIQQNLKSINTNQFISKIYGNNPNLWGSNLTQFQQIKFLINSCTRMRYLKQTDYSLDYKCKSVLSEMPDNLVPWFKVDTHPSITQTIIFGHWASLGFYHTPKFIGLDTGCVWGRSLTAINLDNFEVCQVNNA